MREMRRACTRGAALATLATLGCLISASAAAALPTTSIVQAGNAVGQGSVTCPILSRVLSGGFAGDLGGEITGSLPPTVALRGWSVLLDRVRRPASGTTYAICATGDVTLSRRHQILSFEYLPEFVSTASATCPNPLARVVGGGFQSSSASNALPITDSYPSGPRTWTVRVPSPSLRDIAQGHAFAVCSLLALNTTIRTGSGYVNCGQGTLDRVFGGGWSGGRATASFPSGPRSWVSAVPVASSDTPPVTYAICGL